MKLYAYNNKLLRNTTTGKVLGKGYDYGPYYVGHFDPNLPINDLQVSAEPPGGQIPTEIGYKSTWPFSHLSVIGTLPGFWNAPDLYIKNTGYYEQETNANLYVRDIFSNIKIDGGKGDHINLGGVTSYGDVEINSYGDVDIDCTVYGKIKSVSNRYSNYSFHRVVAERLEFHGVYNRIHLTMINDGPIMTIDFSYAQVMEYGVDLYEMRNQVKAMVFSPDEDEQKIQNILSHDSEHIWYEGTYEGKPALINGGLNG